MVTTILESIVLRVIKIIIRKNILVTLIAIEFLSVALFNIVLIVRVPGSIGFRGLLIILTILVIERSLGLRIIVSSTLKISNVIAESIRCLKF